MAASDALIERFKEGAAERLSLPAHPGLRRQAVDRVLDALASFLDGGYLHMGDNGWEVVTTVPLETCNDEACPSLLFTDTHGVCLVPREEPDALRP